MMTHSRHALLTCSIRQHGVRLATLLALAVSSGAADLQAADARDPLFVARTLRPFLDQHCTGCHDAATKKGGLDLKKLPVDWDVAKNFETWVKVHDRVRAGEMPPGEKRRPPEMEREAVLRGLQAGLV